MAIANRRQTEIMKKLIFIAGFICAILPVIAQDTTLIHLNPNPNTDVTNASGIRTEMYHIKKGIDIPEYTQFIAGLHDTAADQIAWYDTQGLSETNLKAHQMPSLGN